MALSRRHCLALGLLGLWVQSGCGDGEASKKEAGPLPPPTVVYVVRHAEKGEGKDPDLSEAGTRRAAELPGAIELRDLAAIYSTATNRTKQTASSVSAASGLSITRMPPDDYEGLVRRVRSHAGQAVLVVGHSNTVPQMLSALGVTEPVALADDDYGDLFVVTVPAQGPAVLEKRRFGDVDTPSPQ